jgi:hypothetical protein
VRAPVGAPEAGLGRHGVAWHRALGGAWGGEWAGVEVGEVGAVDTRRRLSAPWATLPTGAPATGRGLSGAACGPAPAPAPGARHPRPGFSENQSQGPGPDDPRHFDLWSSESVIGPSKSVANGTFVVAPLCTLSPHIRPHTCRPRTHRPRPSRPRQQHHRHGRRRGDRRERPSLVRTWIWRTRPGPHSAARRSSSLPWR